MTSGFPYLLHAGVTWRVDFLDRRSAVSFCAAHVWLALAVCAALLAQHLVGRPVWFMYLMAAGTPLSLLVFPVRLRAALSAIMIVQTLLAIVWAASLMLLRVPYLWREAILFGWSLFCFAAGARTALRYLRTRKADMP